MLDKVLTHQGMWRNIPDPAEYQENIGGLVKYALHLLQAIAGASQQQSGGEGRPQVFFRFEVKEAGSDKPKTFLAKAGLESSSSTLSGHAREAVCDNTCKFVSDKLPCGGVQTELKSAKLAIDQINETINEIRIELNTKAESMLKELEHLKKGPGGKAP